MAMMWLLIALRTILVAKFVVTGQFCRRNRRADADFNICGARPSRLRRIE